MEGLGEQNTAMISRSAWQVMALALGLVVCGLVTGCGPAEEKVDLAAQVALLGPDQDADTKITALTEIAKLGPDSVSAMNTIVGLLEDEDPVVRRTAAYALGSMGPAAKSAVPELRKLLNTNDRDQMTSVASALQMIEPSSGIRVENVAE